MNVTLIVSTTNSSFYLPGTITQCELSQYIASNNSLDLNKKRSGGNLDLNISW